MPDRIGQVVAQPFARRPGVAAEEHVDADLVRAHRVEARREPEQHGPEHDDGKALAAHGAAAGDEVLDAILAATQNLLEIRGRAAAPALRAGPPRAAAAGPALAPWAPAAALVAPRHE